MFLNLFEVPGFISSNFSIFMYFATSLSTNSKSIVFSQLNNTSCNPSEGLPKSTSSPHFANIVKLTSLSVLASLSGKCFNL